MRATSILAISVLTVLLLAGCAPTTSGADKSPATGDKITAPSTPAPTPTIDPGPVALTKEEAGERYLDLMCQRNDLGMKTNAAFNAKEQEYLNGGNPDVSALKAVATEALRVNRVTVELIDDPYYAWPDGTGALLQTVKQSLLGEAQLYSNIVSAANYQAAYEAPGNSVDPGSAPQEIRYKLGLPADTAASCVGKETAADVLHLEMTERNEYLASFSSETKSD